MITRLLLLLVSCAGTGWSIRPRGVRPELASLYNPAADFVCLDGSATIPFIQVNDDYCDCDDGSDEPGTSACPEGRFYCENKGHNPLVLPSSRVNDGICDCCDGSDEWDSDSQCQDTCMELGRAAREEALAQAKVALQGFSIKQGMIREGKLMQDERVTQVADKEGKKRELENMKEAKRMEKEEAEKPEKEALEFYRQLQEEENSKKAEAENEVKDNEAEELFNVLDTNQDGVVDVAELQVRPGLDTNKDGAVSEDEARFFLSGNDNFDLDTFKQIGFVLVKPYLDLEGVTDAPAEDEELVAPPTEEFTPPPPENPEVYDPWRKNQAAEEVVDDGSEDSDDYDEEDKEEDEDYDIDSAPQDEAEKPEEKIEDKYDERTRELIAAADAARKNYEDVDRQLRDLEREMKDIKDVMEKDFGPENEFAVLSGQCFEYTDNEYVYSMCPYDKCTQRSKNGGSDTRLGGWGEWKGAENIYTTMKFTGGQQCWNGPSRSATIHLHCGTENTVTAVSEPNRCEYEMHFTTPAACSKPAPPHDEL